MKWASAVDTSPSLQEAIERAAARLFTGLGRLEPDLVIAFVSADHSPQYERVPELLHQQFESALTFGCAASAVIGGGKEVEDRPAVSLMGALLPGVGLSAVHLEAGGMPPIYAERSLWEETLGVLVEQRPAFVVLSDPYSFDTEAFVKGLDRAYPRSVKAGGLASASTQPGMNALFLRDRMYTSGAIALALTGNVDMRAVITQGSRPIGEPMFVTQVHENLIRELDGFVPRDILDSLFERLSAEDRELVSNSLFLGVAVTNGRSEYGPGDFLVSDILGMDPETGSLWVNAHVPANHVVQFHLRDVQTADNDLERTLATLRSSLAGSPAAGAMLFSCSGRGSSFYGQPDHDSNAFRRLIGDVPIGGCFCSGEIGPLMQSSYLHGYTSSFAVFTERSG